MNKCNFCQYSTATGQMGAWYCDYYDKNPLERAIKCQDAIETMMEFNEKRAEGNIKAVKASKLMN